ncbi:MAG: hypothetical protein LBC75_00035 [Fibromonadaceae bacterium]|nr:hypothetical protein [Fibromonadaceae bacterium]
MLKNAKIKEDVVRLICRFERTFSGSPECASIMREVAVFCLSSRYCSNSHLCELLEKHFAKRFNDCFEPMPVALGGENVA